MEAVERGGDLVPWDSEVTRSGAWSLISRTARDGKLVACSDPDGGVFAQGGAG